jgi:DEAD/DEAH box helicase domain-containing protein
MVPNPVNPQLEEARNKLASFWNGLIDLPCDPPAQSVPCGNVNDPVLSLRYWWPRELADLATPAPTSPGFVIFNDVHQQNEPERHLTWRRWLWLFNLLQTLPGILLATQDGLDAGDHSTFSFSKGAVPGSGAQSAVHAAAWAAAIEQAMGSLVQGLLALVDAGLPPPDQVGYELEEAGEVIAEAELAWFERRLVLLMPAQNDSATIWQANGWRVVMADDDWQQKLAKALENQSTQNNTQEEGEQ